MRVLMTGGGTGGHVNPALAIANTIKENEPESEIAFVGTPRGIENKLVPAAGYKLYHVDVMGIRRSLSPKNIKAAYLALTSPVKAKKIIKEFKPDIVIGTGGYVSWPVVKAAADMGIPTALHESNAVAGMTVKMLSSRVDRIYLNFEKAGEGLSVPEKILHVGCPLLSKFSNISKAEARAKLGIPESVKCYVLSFGGSLGAEKVNDAVFTLMQNYTGGREGVFHTHATGTIEKDIARGWFTERGLDKYDNIKLVEYIYDMPYRMAAADIVICRAGALTVSELALDGKCAVFIPSPNVTDDQQYKNARVLEEASASVIIRENPETGEKLTQTVKRLC
ncbi:MAG: UDP-N-acetylglucosamine--N-acetylmuramyl-(pentapeptide) pyrophosphoryl-undecaprenol N-acetylglucosamine transferase, partial [Clostridia bacterium]|nr:UDP-N-acetylglucosamine--N-acetylmuramyl-(pentapeptide) pyrophosphoryl-undecaprenol N-acetylglucosamine transferase [Clostridia bacterium]